MIRREPSSTYPYPNLPLPHAKRRRYKKSQRILVKRPWLFVAWAAIPQDHTAWTVRLIKFTDWGTTGMTISNRASMVDITWNRPFLDRWYKMLREREEGRKP